MQTLSLALRQKDQTGEPIPDVFPGLASVHAHIRRGQLSMVAGPPGGGKTAFITDWVLNAADEYGNPVDVLYFSADSDKATVGNRVAASCTGYTLDQTERFLNEGKYGVLERVSDATRHIWYCFDASLTQDFIMAETQAYGLSQGKYPDWIVVDNLINVKGDNGQSGEHAVFAETAEFLHELARETGSAITVLHHATGGYADGDQPLPLSAILGKVDKPQRLILTIHRPDESTMSVSVVKNSNGPADATGHNVTTDIPIDLSRMYFSKR